MTNPSAWIRRPLANSIFRTVVVALMLALLVMHPATAYSILKETGSQGAYIVTDTFDSPGGRCAYGNPNANGVASFRWMRLGPPTVFARDITTERDRQPVAWRFRLQRSPSGTGEWINVATSPWEEARAHDDVGADFHAMKLSHASRGAGFYRGVIQIRWLRRGNVEGSVALAIERYAVKWTVGDPAYVFEGPCTNKAD